MKYNLSDSPSPDSFAHFPGLSPASFYLESTLNNSDSLWAPCSRRTWTSTSFLPSLGILHFHHLQKDTGGQRGRRGPNHYSFPLCAFIPLAASEQPVRTWMQVKKLLWRDNVCWISGKECTVSRGGVAYAGPLPSSIRSSCPTLLQVRMACAGAALCWLKPVTTKDSMDKQSSWQLSPGHFQI